MAKENNDISDLVKKCKILLLDIEGTTTSISFVKDKLFPYAEQNVKSFLESYWEEEEVKGAVAALRKLALEDRENNVDGAIVIPGEDAGREEQIEGLVNSVKWQMSIDRKAGPMKELQGLIWKVGYDKGEIKGHVYDDVSSALELWRSLEGQKVYIYSSGSVKAQKLLFRHSLVGDLLPHIEGHFDTAMGAKREAASYAAIAEKIGCKPEEILFLTDIVQEAEAAQKAGLQAALVSREGNAPLPAEAVSFPVLHSFEQLTVTNKRKPELQAEEVPAKVPKNDALDDVKTKTEMESELTPNANGSSEENGAAEKIEEPEKMEVEETSDVVAQTKAENVSNTALVNTNSASTEVDKVAVKDVPMVDAATDPAFVTDMKTVAVNTNASDGPKETAMKDATTETVDVSTPVMEIAEENNSAAKVEVQVAETKADSAPVQSNPMDTLDEKATKAAIKAEESAKAAAQLKTEETPAAQAVVDTLPQESKTSDTPIVEASPIETESMEIPIEEPNTTETPIAETKTQTLATKTTVMDAPAVEVTSVETTCQENASMTPDVESKFAVSKTQKALDLQKSAADSKTETNAEVADSKAIEAEAPVQDITISDNLPKVTSVTDASIADEVATSTARPAEGEEAAEKIEKTVVEAIVEDDVIGAVDVPACEIEPVVEENVEKTDTNETEKMETEATEDVETDTEPKKPAESSQGDTGDTESTVIIQDITDDNQSLSEVTVNDIIDDLVPIVEEPSPMEEIDALQNAGDVLEKECDEILSKVQDVTNLDFIKPLHTITEEMETENIDSNDIVEGILDTEMDLNMKPCEDIDLNVVQEISETTTENEEKTDDAKTVIDKPCKSVSNVEEKTEVKAVAEEKTENKQEVPSEINNSQETEAKLKPAVEDMELDNKIIEPESKGETETKVETAESISEPQGRKNDTEKSVDEPATEIKETEKNLEISDKITEVMQNEKENNVTKDAKTDTDAAETKVNGNSNGDTVVKVNGNSIKDDELTSRLSGDNSKEEVNGPNSDFANAEEGQGDNKVEPEIPDIKMKAVATDESRQPIEQPTEA